MGESTQWTKKQKVSATQFTSKNAVCEDCGRNWTATLAEVPVTILIKDLDDYYKKLKNNLLEAIKPTMVLCVFRPSDREFWDTEDTLSCVAPLQDSPYQWKINHKHKGPAGASGCQIIPLTDKEWKMDSESMNPEEEPVMIKEEINDNADESNNEMIFDHFSDVQDVKPDIYSDIKLEDKPVVVSMNPIFNVKKDVKYNKNFSFICQKRKKSGGKQISLASANEQSIIKLKNAAEKRKNLGEMNDIFDRIDTYLQIESTIKIKWHTVFCYGPFTQEDKIQRLALIHENPEKPKIKEALNLQPKVTIT